MEEVSFNHYKEYTTTEEPWGYWIDGSVIYRKTIVIDGEPNHGVAYFDTGIDDLDKIIKFENIRYWDDGSGDGSGSWMQVRMPEVISGKTGNVYWIGIDWREASTNVWRPHVVIRTYVRESINSQDNTLDTNWHHIVTIYYTKTSS